ncbi:hypothetical protein [Sphingomonas yabuuchiae]|uniref:hypothetical protein n=1 Tax=Sphingomonas yabuuchiae TaxID=172044 RepID=UPI001C853D4C|nr:hypothetical protein [Sphingomonas yabuuchiae]
MGKTEHCHDPAPLEAGERTCPAHPVCEERFRLSTMMLLAHDTFLGRTAREIRADLTWINGAAN